MKVVNPFNSEEVAGAKLGLAGSIRYYTSRYGYMLGFSGWDSNSDELGVCQDMSRIAQPVDIVHIKNSMWAFPAW